MKELMKMGRQMGKTTSSLETLRDLVTNVTSPMALVLSEGQFLGQTYYCVEPQGWAYAGRFSWADMITWCETTLDRMPGPLTTDPRWFVSGKWFCFRNEADRMMFVLRWA